MTSMTLGSDYNCQVILVAVLAGVAPLAGGCQGRRAVPAAVPPTKPAATATPTPRLPIAEPTATAVPSLAPPSAIDSLPAGAPATLRTAARMVERARDEFAAGRVDEALQLLEQAMQVETAAPFAYYYMAAIYLERGRLAEAEVLAQRAATLSQGYPAGWAGHAHALRGRAWEELGDGDRAIQAYRAALAADRGNTVARAALQRLGESW